MQRNDPKQRSALREANERDSSSERSHSPPRFSRPTDGYHSIRIDYIARSREVERVFRDALRTIEPKYGRINWEETRVIVPQENRERPAHCFLHFVDIRVHSRVAEEMDGTFYDRERTAWSLSWYSSRRPLRPIRETRSRSPPHFELALDRTNRSVSPPASAIAAAHLSRRDEPATDAVFSLSCRPTTSLQSSITATTTMLEPARPVLSAALESSLRELTFESAQQSAIQQEQRTVEIVIGAVKEAIAPLLAAEALRIAPAPVFPVGSWGEANQAALCRVCYMELSSLDEASVWSLACGHICCRSCCDQVRREDPQANQQMKCPYCRRISLPFRLFIFKG